MCERKDLDATPGSFARSIFCFDALAPRFRKEKPDDERVLAESTIAASIPGTGGWPEYDPSYVVSRRPLKETQYSGRRADSMFIHTFGEEFEQERAFVTQYPDKGSSGTPRIEQAHSQMAVWAFCDALGVDVPRHQWVEEERKVVVEEVGTPIEKTWTVLALGTASCADKIDCVQLKDLFSVQLLAGIEDLRHQNLNIGESGRVYVFDFDKADQVFENHRVLSHSCNKACKTIDMLNEIRTNPLQLNRDEICERVREIATELADSPHKEPILETVRHYDSIFSEETEKEFAELFENNINNLTY